MIIIDNIVSIKKNFKKEQNIVLQLTICLPGVDITNQNSIDNHLHSYCEFILKKSNLVNDNYYLILSNQEHFYGEILNDKFYFNENFLISFKSKINKKTKQAEKILSKLILKLKNYQENQIFQ